MATMPGLPALNVQVPKQESPLDQFAKAQQVMGNMQQLQMQRRTMQDQDAATKAMHEWDGQDLNALPSLMLKNGASSTAVFNAKKQILEQQQAKQAMDTGAIALQSQKNNLLLGKLETAKDVPDEQLIPHLTKSIQDAAQQGLIAPQAAQQTLQQITQAQDPTQIRSALSLYEKSLMGEQEQHKQLIDTRNADSAAMTAQARKDQAAAAQQKLAPMNPQQIQNANAQFTNRFQVNNPGKPLPPEYTLPATATRADWEQVDKQMEQVEKAQAAQATNATNRANSQDNKNTTRADKSYQLSTNQIDKAAAPIEQRQQRMSRLMESINQNSPQADSLIAPELLSVVAGGSGSGLRMTESEISRVVGGRSEWESIKAAANKWSLDPTKALSVTPEQRTEIKSLLSEIQKRDNTSLQTINDARDALLNSDDPMEHRRIVNRVKTGIVGAYMGNTGGTGNANQPAAAAFDPQKDFKPIR